MKLVQVKRVFLIFLTVVLIVGMQTASDTAFAQSPGEQNVSARLSEASVEELFAAYQEFENGAQPRTISIDFDIGGKQSAIGFSAVDLRGDTYRSGLNGSPSSTSGSTSWDGPALFAADPTTLPSSSDFARLSLVRQADGQSILVIGSISIEGKLLAVNEEHYLPSANGPIISMVKPPSEMTLSFTALEDALTLPQGSCGEESVGISSDAPTVQTSSVQLAGTVTPPVETYTAWPSDVVLQVTIATEADYEFVSRYGSAKAANDAILAMMNTIDGLYRSQLGVAVKVTYQNAWTIPLDPYEATESRARLQEFSRAGNFVVPKFGQGKEVGDPKLGASLLFSGIRNSDSSILGIANTDSVCAGAERGYAGGAIFYFDHPAVTAHELAHILGAKHDSSCSSSSLMCPIYTGGLNFSGAAAQSIRNSARLQDRFCYSQIAGSHQILPPRLVSSRIWVKSYDYSQVILIDWIPDTFWNYKAIDLYLNAPGAAPCSGTPFARDEREFSNNYTTDGAHAKPLVSSIENAPTGNWIVYAKAVGADNQVSECSSTSVLTSMLSYPTFVEEPQDLVIPAQGQGELRCRATGEGQITYQWYVGGDPISGATGPTINITSSSKAVTQGYPVTCLARSSNGAGRFSRAATVVGAAPKGGLSWSEPKSYWPGSSFSLTCPITGPGISYVWAMDGTVIPGATTGVLKITNFTKSATVECRATNINGTTTSSQLFTVSQTPLKAQLANPEEEQISFRDLARYPSWLSLSCTVTGPSVTYIWKRNGVTLNPSNDTRHKTSMSYGSQILTIDPVGKEDSNALYQCYGTNPSGATILGATHRILINQPPQLTGTLENIESFEGESASMICPIAPGEGGSLRWFRNGSVVKGATERLALTVSASDFGASFYCQANNPHGRVDSNPATFVRTKPPTIAPIADVTVESKYWVDVPCPATGRDITERQWWVNGTLAGTSHYGTVYSIKTESSVRNNSQKVQCGATNKAGSTKSNEFYVHFTYAPSIEPFSTQPLQVFKNTGSTIDCRATNGTISYQWFLDGKVVATTAHLRFDDLSFAFDDAAHSLQCIATNAIGKTSGERISVALFGPPVLRSPTTSTEVVRYDGESANLTVESSGVGVSYQWFHDGKEIPGANGKSLRLAVLNASRAGTYRCDITNKAGSVSSPAVTVRVLGVPVIKPLPASVRVFSGQKLRCEASNVPTEYRWYLNRNLVGSDEYLDTSKLGAGLVGKSNTIRCTASNPAGSAESNTSALEILGAPTFHVPSIPQSLELWQGDSTHLDLAVDGEGVVYTWYHDGKVIPAASEPTLRFPTLVPTDSGVYYATASNPAGSIRSADFTLLVNAGPTITAPAKAIHLEKFVGEALTIGVNADGKQLQYLWYKGSALLAGATGPSITFAALRLEDSGVYHCEVSNPGGSVDSVEIALDVRVYVPPPTDVSLSGILPAKAKLVSLSSGWKVRQTGKKFTVTGKTLSPLRMQIIIKGRRAPLSLVYVLKYGTKPFSTRLLRDPRFCASSVTAYRSLAFAQSGKFSLGTIKPLGPVAVASSFPRTATYSKPSQTKVQCG